ncbi:MAG: hypothetical protein K2W95_34590, partial [Candidatus Obscuribacterales bacterium]|nr:hypothetical protein [Candidatus Obscuribacterales bacterium]
MAFTRHSNLSKVLVVATCAVSGLNLVLPYASKADPEHLDLSSADRNIAASHAGEIIVNGVAQSVSPGTMLTAGEHVALQQVLSGSQTIVLSAAGAAIGGTLSIAGTVNPTGSLVIPAGVTAIQTAASLNLAGNFNNSGAFYAAPSAATAVINAANIFNNQGAIISTLLPASLGITPAMPVNLSLIAAMDIINAGQIISAANLNLSAGGSIINALPAGATGALPVMQAMNTINMMAGSGNINNIVNAGIINAMNGNINVASQILQSNIVMNNLGGQLLASLGNINIRDASFVDKFDFSLIGGDIVAEQLSIFSGTGTARLSVNDITALVNVDAGAAHVEAATQNLQLGSLNIVGDPTFFNTSGDVSLMGNISTSGNPLAIIASGNVTASKAPTPISISTSGTTTGGNIFIGAGVDFTSNGASSGSNDTTTQLTINGFNTTGGNIDLSNVTQLTSAGGKNAGGTIVMVAGGGSANPGTINLVNTTTPYTIDSTAPTAGGGGPVILISGATSGTGINVGDINTTAAAAPNSGSIFLIAASNPTFSGTPFNVTDGGVPGTAGISVNAYSNAGITAGTLTGNTPTVSVISQGTVNIGSINTKTSGASTGPVTITGGSVTVGNIDVSGGAGGDGKVILVGSAAGGKLSAGDINISGVAPGGGYVTAVAATPTITPFLLTNIPGGVASGGLLSSTSTISAPVTTGKITAQGSPVTLVTGGLLTVTGDISLASATGALVTLVGGGGINAQGVKTSGAGVTLFAGGTGASSAGLIDTSGGTSIQVFAGNVAANTGLFQITNNLITPTSQISTGAVSSGSLTINQITTQGGSVDLVSGGNITVTNGITTSAPAVVGGSVNIGAAGTVTSGAIDTTANGGGLNGGVLIMGGGISLTGAVTTAGTAAAAGGQVVLLTAQSTMQTSTVTFSVVPSVNIGTFDSGAMLTGSVSGTSISTNGAPVTAIANGGINLTGSVAANTTAVGVNGASVVLAGTGAVSVAGVATSGGKGAANGNAVLIGGTSVSATGLIDTKGASGSTASNGGEVAILTGAPVLSGNPFIVVNAINPASPLSVNAITNGNVSVQDINTSQSPITIVAGGNVTLTGAIKTEGITAVNALGGIIAGGLLGVLAGGNITTGSATASIDTSGSVADSNGSNVVLFAGAQFAAAPNLYQAIFTKGKTEIEVVDTLAVNVTGPSTSGGNIDLTGGGANALTTFTTNASPGSGQFGYTGGNVSIFAQTGATNPGNITLPSGKFSLTTAGSNPPTPQQNPGGASITYPSFNGNVVLLSTATAGTITTGNIDTSNGGVSSYGGAGNITVAAAAPQTVNMSYTDSSGLGAVLAPSTSTTTGAIVVNNLTAVGGSQSFKFGQGQTLTTTISAVTGGTINVLGNISNQNNALPAGANPNPAGGLGGLASSSIILDAFGQISFGTGVMIESKAGTPNVQTLNGADGGSVSITGASFAFNGGIVKINVDATGGGLITAAPSPRFSGGNGGSVTIQSTGTSGTGLDIVVGPNSFDISAQGDVGSANTIQPTTLAQVAVGNGGKVTLHSAANINITAANLNANPQPGSNSFVNTGTSNLMGGSYNTLFASGKGATYNFSTKGNLLVTGDLRADGAASTVVGAVGYAGGDGGIIGITLNNGAATFTIGGTVGTNGITGVLSASGNLAAVGATPTQGSGGVVYVNNAGGGIIINQSMTGGLLVAAAPATSVNSGALNTLYQAGNGGGIGLFGTTVLSVGNLDASGGSMSATQPSGNGGAIVIQTTGGASGAAFTITSTAGTVTNGIIGNLTAVGNTGVGVVTPTGSSGFINFLPTGSGGSITITNTGTGGILMDGSTTFSIAAQAANATLGNTPGDGGSITLTAANGPVLFQTTLNASGGAGLGSGVPEVYNDGIGGSIIITTNSPVTAGNAAGFSVTAAPTGGGAQGLVATGYSGGTVSVTNSGGGFFAGTGLLSVTATGTKAGGAPTGGTGGTVFLSGSGNIGIAGGILVDGTPANFGGFGGSVTILNTNSSSPFIIGMSTQPTAGQNGIGVSGKAGPALSASGATGDAGAGNAGVIYVSNPSGITVNAGAISLNAPSATASSFAGDGGTITLEAVTGPVSITGALTANAGAGSGKFRSGFAGSIFITNSTGAGTPFTVGTAGSPLTLLSANGWNGGTVTVKNNVSDIQVASGAITVNADVANLLGDPTAVGQTNIAGPGGFITLNAPQGKITVGSLDVSGGALFQQIAGAVPVAGTNVVINVASTQGFGSTQAVTISGTVGGVPTSETQTINSVTANTSITVGKLNNTYDSAPTVSSFQVFQQATNDVGYGFSPATAALSTLATTPLTAGTTVITVDNVLSFQPGDQIYISNGPVLLTATQPASTSGTILVTSTLGLAVGQTISLSGAGGGNQTVTITALDTPGSPTGTNGAAQITTGAFTPYTAPPTVSFAGLGETVTIAPGGVTGNQITITSMLVNNYLVAPSVSVTSIPLQSAVGFSPGQTVLIENPQTSTIAAYPTAGPFLTNGTNVVVPVSSAVGFAVGQTVSISGPVTGGLGSIAENQMVTAVDTVSMQNTITLAAVNFTYTTSPKITVFAQTEQAVVSSVDNMTNTVVVNQVALSHLTEPFVSSANAVFQVASTAGYIVGETVAISGGGVSEVQFITGLDTANNRITTGLLSNTYSMPGITAFAPDGTISINGGSGISQTQPMTGPQNVLSAGTILLTSQTAVGSSTSPIQLNILSDLTRGSLVVNAGSAYLNNISNFVSLGQSTIGHDFYLSANGNIHIDGAFSSTAGSASFVVVNPAFGGIYIAQNVSAGNPLLFQNNNISASGVIEVSSGVTVSGGGFAGGPGVTFSSGNPPVVPVPGTAPAGVTPTVIAPNNIFYGANGFTTSGAAAGIKVDAHGANVVFNGQTTGSILIGDNAYIYA